MYLAVVGHHANAETTMAWVVLRMQVAPSHTLRAAPYMPHLYFDVHVLLP